MQENFFQGHLKSSFYKLENFTVKTENKSPEFGIWNSGFSLRLLLKLVVGQVWWCLWRTFYHRCLHVGVFVVFLMRLTRVADVVVTFLPIHIAAHLGIGLWHMPLKQDIVSDGLLDTPGSRPGPLTPTLRLAMTPRVWKGTCELIHINFHWGLCSRCR